MFKILVKESGYWGFAIDKSNNEAQFESLNNALAKVDNLLDFYPRNCIKIVTETKFSTNVTEGKVGILG